MADLKQWCRNLEAERITMSGLVPTLLYWLLDLPEASSHDLSALRTVYYGAAPMSPSKLKQLQDRFGNIFLQIYGSTECLQPATTLCKADHIGADPKRLASAGRVSLTVELRVMDEAGNPLPAGATGEVWIRSRATISGYFNNPKERRPNFAMASGSRAILAISTNKAFSISSTARRT
ncbi:AMP-binding protein [Massilia cavernae]|uniref:AMP-binding protein n=1 Tax=Massilia cavernae TaxID=2320864 RepID=UPI00351D77F4